MLQQLHADFRFIDAETNRAHRARVAQLAHRTISAVEEFPQTRRVLFAMGQAADIVTEQDVDARHTEALEALGV